MKHIKIPKKGLMEKPGKISPNIPKVSKRELERQIKALQRELEGHKPPFRLTKIQKRIIAFLPTFWLAWSLTHFGFSIQTMEFWIILVPFFILIALSNTLGVEY